MSEELITEVVEQYADFSLFVEEVKEEKPKAREKKERPLCVFAQQYKVQVEEICREVVKEPTFLSINEAYLRVFKKGMEWRLAMPKSHRNHMSGRGHYCVWHVLEDSYLRLRWIELSLPERMHLLPVAVLPREEPPLPPPLFPDICIDEPT